MQTDFHVAVVLDRLGRRLGELKVPTTLKGYRELVLGQGGTPPTQPYVGNRDANRVLHMICVVRIGSDRRTRSHVARRLAKGKSKWEIMRCLKL